VNTRLNFKKRWRKAAKWILVTVCGSIIALLIGHYGEAILSEDSEGGPDVRVVAEASMVNPRQGDSASGEYVCLVNEDDGPVSLTAWKLYDSVGRVNEFSRFSLEPGGSVRIHPGGRPLSDTAVDVYGDSSIPRWTNSGDTIVLRNAEDEKVESQSYPTRRDGGVSGTCGPLPRRDWDCDAFTTHAQAQSFFLTHGRPERDPYDLDTDGDGLACE